MTIPELIIYLVVIGLLLFAVGLIPWIDARWKNLIYVIVAVAVVVWIAFRLLGNTSGGITI